MLKNAHLWALAVVVALAGFAPPSAALTLLRDPDIEHALKQLLIPVVRPSGLSAGRIDVLVIKDDKMNAFIVDDRTVFVHSGLITRLDSAAELQAVLAHEVAHIANGHVIRRISNRRSMGRATAAGIALGVAAALAGSPDAGSGIAAGVAGSAQRVFLGHSRAEEAAADASGLRYMAEAGVDPNAAATVLERFRGQASLNIGRQDPYVRGHPLARDRMRAVRGLAAGLRIANIDQGAADYWFLRARGKLAAFLGRPGRTLSRVRSNPQSDLALMQRAIAFHRRPDPGKARAEIDRLLALRPKDPFYHELRGQILLENRNPAAAVKAYRRAADLAPRNALILAGLGRAHLAAGQDKAALAALKKAHTRDSRDPRLLRDLAVAHARRGSNGQASLATAERYALLGRPKDASVHAKRAVGLLPTGSPGWRRAQDILAMPGAKRK